MDAGARARKLAGNVDDVANSIAHQDLEPSDWVAGRPFNCRRCDPWRGACDGLARSFESVMR